LSLISCSVISSMWWGNGSKTWTESGTSRHGYAEGLVLIVNHLLEAPWLSCLPSVEVQMIRLTERNRLQPVNFASRPQWFWRNGFYIFAPFWEMSQHFFSLVCWIFFGTLSQPVQKMTTLTWPSYSNRGAYLKVQDILWKTDSNLVSQIVASFHYETQRFIAVLTKARHWIISWASRIQFAPSSPISVRSSLMLSSHLRLGLPSGLLPSGLPTRTL